jgi:hypothetical protein
MTSTFINIQGELEVDPSDRRKSHLNWLKKINYDTNQVDYYSFKTFSEEGSYYLTRYLIDLWEGKNLAKGTKRGRRSFNHIFGCKTRISRVLTLLHERNQKKLFDLNEDDTLSLFNDMREGKILTQLGNRFKSVGSYAKLFISFWHWLMRIKKKENTPLLDIVGDIDTRESVKPQWNYLTLKQVEIMSEYASEFYYKVLIFFLFDSGIRAPKELMNVRIKDIIPIPNSNLLFLEIRDDTSKTFGRKIKLMICSDLIKKYIEMTKSKPDDFLFPRSYVSTTRSVQRMGYKAFQIGKIKRAHRKVIVTKGITMYDFRHCSVCHYLPIYKSENQIKYRYGWKKTEMIHYYSEFLGMKDTIREEDMLVDTTKTELQQQLAKSEQKTQILEEQLNAQKQEMEEKLKKLETMMLQKFADNYTNSSEITPE